MSHVSCLMSHNLIKRKAMKLMYLPLCFAILLSLSLGCQSQTENQNNHNKKLSALIIDGQNNHEMWPKTTIMMKQYLEETGLFTVDVERTAFTWKGEEWLEKYPLEKGKPTTAVEKPQTDPNFKPEFSKYDVVISNFGWMAAPWPDSTQRELEDYYSNGGGQVCE